MQIWNLSELRRAESSTRKEIGESLNVKSLSIVPNLLANRGHCSNPDSFAWGASRHYDAGMIGVKEAWRCAGSETTIISCNLSHLHPGIERFARLS